VPKLKKEKKESMGMPQGILWQSRYMPRGATKYLILGVLWFAECRAMQLDPLFSASESKRELVYASLQELTQPGHFKDLSWAVVQYDSRDVSSGRIPEILHRNRRYCDMHNYTHYLFREGLEDIPPYWRKVEIVRRILSLKIEDAPVFRGVMWLDTDAVIWNYANYTLDGLLPSGFSFAYSADPQGIDSPSPFNAGVWMVRNSKKGRAIMKHWMSLFVPEQWRVSEKGKWVSSGRMWAGDEYEQGSFRNHVLQQGRFSESLLQLPWYVLNGIPGATYDRSFVLHFCGLANALSAGLVAVDSTIVELLRIKYEQSRRAQMHRTYMQYLSVNFGVALLRLGSELGSYDMLKESEEVFLEELREDPGYELCKQNLGAVRKHMRAHPKHEL